MLFISDFFCLQGGAVSSDSLSESDSKGAGSSLLDALSLLPSENLDHARKLQRDGPQSPTSFVTHCHAPQVPYIVNCCIKHLETYGECVDPPHHGHGYLCGNTRVATQDCPSQEFHKVHGEVNEKLSMVCTHHTQF